MHFELIQIKLAVDSFFVIFYFDATFLIYWGYLVSTLETLYVIASDLY